MLENMQIDNCMFKNTQILTINRRINLYLAQYILRHLLQPIVDKNTHEEKFENLKQYFKVMNK